MVYGSKFMIHWVLKVMLFVEVQFHPALAQVLKMADVSMLPKLYLPKASAPLGTLQTCFIRVMVIVIATV